MGAQFERTLAEAMTFLAVYSIVMFALASIPYTLRSHALYKIAKRIRLQFRWLAWVPIMQYHIIAQVADRYRVSIGRNVRVRTAFEISIFLLIALIFGLIQTQNLYLICGICVMLSITIYVKFFALYYFYRYIDKESATIFFFLGSASGIANSIFIFICRDNKAINLYQSAYI